MERPPAAAPVAADQPAGTVAEPPPPAPQPPPILPEQEPPPYAPPRVISGFSPTAGTPGTHVMIVGENFGPSDAAVLDQVVPGGVTEELSLPIVRRGAGFLEVEIPANARMSGRLVVTGPGRAPARSAQIFQLLRMAPPLVVAPQITNFAPAEGPLGTTLRVWGDHFQRGDRVAIGGVLLPTTVVTEQLLQAVVTAPAAFGPVEVRRGTLVSAARGSFRVVEPAPQILGFAPASGRPGTTVYVTGQHFAASDALLLGDVPLPVLARSATQIVVTVPAGAHSARFVLAGPGHAPMTSAQVFTVEVIATPPPPPPPQITSFSPAAGPVGTEVRLYGQFDPHDTVLLGNLEVPIAGRWPQMLLVRIPEGAWSDVFRVMRKGGPVATSATAFHVMGADAPAISRIEPLASEPGGNVTIDGARFHGVEQVLLGGAVCGIVSRNETQLTVTVPGGLPGGYFTLRGRGFADVISREYFTVRPRMAPPLVGPPRIFDVTPRRASVGQRVQIIGENFIAKDQVWFNGRLMPVDELLPQRITFTIPVGARTDIVLIRRGGSTIASPSELQILDRY